jgi:hypothetical protein
MTDVPRLDDLDTGGDGAELLDELRATLGKYLALPSDHTAVAVALWIAATHAQGAWEHATRLVVKSPVKRCGKSRLLDLLEHLCHAPLVTVNISPAALVRTITTDDPPTILVDEADTIFGTRKQADNNEDLRGIINAGHQRGRPYTRWDVQHRQLDQSVPHLRHGRARRYRRHAQHRGGPRRHRRHAAPRTRRAGHAVPPPPPRARAARPARPPPRLGPRQPGQAG